MSPRWGPRKEVRDGGKEKPRERRWLGGGQESVKSGRALLHSLWDWNTSVQHHIPFHTEFFSPSHLNLLRVPYIKQNAQFNTKTLKTWGTQAVGVKNIYDFKNKDLTFYKK